MTAPTIAGWVFSEAVQDLSTRRRDMNKRTPDATFSAAELAAMWDALADDFDAASYPRLADGCRKRARGLVGER
jgi:hypothetical protein